MAKKRTKATKLTYAERLKDPRWQRRKTEILTRDNWTCKECSSTRKTLHVHHKFYLRGKEPWEYPDHLLITLCEDCHSDREDAILVLNTALINASTRQMLYLARKIERELIEHEETIQAIRNPENDWAEVVSKSDGKKFFDKLRESLG